MAKENRTAEQTVGGEAGAVKLFATREIFKSKGKEFYSYKINAKLRGRDKEIHLKPPNAGRQTDGGGYGVLDLVFDDADSVEFVQTFEDYQQDGKKMTRTVYIVRSPDPERPGEYYQCPVVPDRPSDRALLDMLLVRTV